MPQDQASPGFPTTATHWGTYRSEVRDGRLVGLHPFELDGDPSPIGRSVAPVLDGPLRGAGPMVRRAWLARREKAGGADRRRSRSSRSAGMALDLVAGEIARVRAAHGNRAIYAGSYGWASAGRFHHAQSQMRRFLNLAGGYTRSVNAYSYAAAQVIVPRVIGDPRGLLDDHTQWPAIADGRGLVVMFGGMPMKNAQVHSGGVSRHTVREGLQQSKAAGCEFVLVGPLQSDAADFLGAEWLRPRPNTDTAIMLGLAHTLVAEGLHDRPFLDRYTEGFDRFLPYLMGEGDGQAKDADWAAGISGLDAATIRGLARRMAARRTMISVGWSVQRGDHGEQPYWMAIVLAAMLGQIGLAGGGFGFGYADMNGQGNPVRAFPWPSVPQGINPVKDFIPVARISDMLLNPGAEFDFDGGRAYPEIRCLLGRRQSVPPSPGPWPAHGRVAPGAGRGRARAVLERNRASGRHRAAGDPPFERNDLSCAGNDGHLVAMHRAVAPAGQAQQRRLRRPADRFGLRELRGRDEEGWLRHLYAVIRQRGARLDIDFPEFDAFWAKGWFALPPRERAFILMEEFRTDPVANRLATPSGRIEIFSAAIDGFGYDDCPGHPAWMEPAEWLGGAGAARHPLHLISNQPDRKLHSQYDHGPFCREGKVAGREAIWLNPADAAARGIASGDLVRVFNDRGQCLAGAVVTDQVMPRVVQADRLLVRPAEPGVPARWTATATPTS
jgi:biotin/methionine sulfoxide reductase